VIVLDSVRDREMDRLKLPVILNSSVTDFVSPVSVNETEYDSDRLRDFSSVGLWVKDGVGMRESDMVPDSEAQLFVSDRSSDRDLDFETVRVPVREAETSEDGESVDDAVNPDLDSVMEKLEV
jgi:hypothetical protein